MSPGSAGTGPDQIDRHLTSFDDTGGTVQGPAAGSPPGRHMRVSVAGYRVYGTKGTEMAGKKGKNGKGKPGGLARLILPVASTVVLATAAVHSVIDREAEHPNGHCPGPLSLHPPEEKNGLLDKVARRLPWLKPILAVKDRYGELGGDKLAAAFTFQAFCRCSRSSWWGSPWSAMWRPAPMWTSPGRSSISSASPARRPR